MAVRLDHLALAAHDAQESARFLADLFGLPDPRPSGPFLAVDVDDTLRIDYAVPPVAFPGQHVAFLVDDATFDAVRRRLDEAGTPYGPGPGGGEPGTVNHGHGGRGLYVDDPAGHHFEILTRRYEGSPGAIV